MKPAPSSMSRISKRIEDKNNNVRRCSDTTIVAYEEGGVVDEGVHQKARAMSIKSLVGGKISTNGLSRR